MDLIGGNSPQANEGLGESLYRLAIEISESKDFYELSKKTLMELRKLASAEGASLYLVESQRHLRLVQVQNEQVDLSDLNLELEINKNSFAGSCALTRRSIHIPNVHQKNSHFQFYSHVDETAGYQTKDTICFPLAKKDREVVGVIQLVNSKRKAGFSTKDLEAGQALSSLIAVSLERALLYEQIEELFEGFVKASVSAIESRDPSTQGHSVRVAQMTVALANAVHDSKAGVFSKRFFSAKHIREIRFASLLHDFGKIGVPEKLLLKERRLFPEEMKEIGSRLKLLNSAYPEKERLFINVWRALSAANEPETRRYESCFLFLEKFVDKGFRVLNQFVPVLRRDEWMRLIDTKGSLSSKERERIQSHVSHTLKFLSNIPWTKDLHRVPEIAGAHHEKLDGSGYPNALSAEDIPFEAQIMSVCDIYDALVAHDRPYKKKIDHIEAIAILQQEALKKRINSDLVRLFIEQRIYQSANKETS